MPRPCPAHGSGGSRWPGSRWRAPAPSPPARRQRGNAAETVRRAPTAGSAPAAALQVGLELLFHVERQTAVAAGEHRQEVRVVAFDQLVEQRALRLVAGIAHRANREREGGLHARSVASSSGGAPATNPGTTFGSVSCVPNDKARREAFEDQLRTSAASVRAKSRAAPPYPR